MKEMSGTGKLAYSRAIDRSRKGWNEAAFTRRLENGRYESANDRLDEEFLVVDPTQGGPRFHELARALGFRSTAKGDSYVQEVALWYGIARSKDGYCQILIGLDSNIFNACHIFWYEVPCSSLSAISRSSLMAAEDCYGAKSCRDMFHVP